MRPTAGSLLLSFLVIATVTSADEADPGREPAGGLLALLPDGGRGEMPLRHTDVRVEISGFVARTIVEQTFVNPHRVPIEAVYTYPLGDEAAVDDFELRSGGRVIRGEIMRREEARDVYRAARVDGRQAALLEQERPNVFVQSIANLMPGDDVRIRVQTIEVLEYGEGTYEYVLPLVVARRYDPSPTLAGSISYATRPATDATDGDGHEAHGVTLHVDLAAGIPIRSIESPTRTIYVTHRSPTRAEIELAEVDRVASRDFILRWNVSAERPEIGLLAHRDAGEGAFALLLQPLGRIDAVQAAPKEVIFVLDTSGSMSGAPLEMSVAFVRAALRTLGPNDRFNMIRFDSDDARFSRTSLPNEPTSVRRALRWLARLRSKGGTEMLRGLRRAVDDGAAAGEFRQVVFLTDGFIGDEDPILEAISALPDAYRVFTVGIGNSVNHHLLDRMARRGDGEYTFVSSNADGRRALDRFRRWVTRPFLTDLDIDWGGLPVADVVPRRPRDLYAGQNLYLIGRYVAPARGTVTLRGWLGGSYWEREIDVELPEQAPEHVALASVWARHRIEELVSDESDMDADEVRDRVTELALRHRLMSPYTSFVAVDLSAVVNAEGVCRRVVQAVFDEGDDAPELEVDGLTERVRVTAGAPLVDLASNATTRTFSDEFMQDLPVPGVFRQAAFSTTGAPSRDYAAIVGGVADIAPAGAGSLAVVPPGSVEETDLVTAGATVDFGRAQGGFASVIQKQGSNEPEVDLRASAASEHGSRAAALRVSGAIVKDRLWFRAAHDVDDRREPIDTTRELLVAPARTVRHDDRLTWQVSRRSKLALSLRAARIEDDLLDVDSRRGAPSARATDLRSASWALEWVTPVSPKLFVQSSLSRQRLDHADSPWATGETNDCVPGGGPFGTAYCDDWAGGEISGSWFLDVEDRRIRDTVRSEADVFAGRLLGATHRVRVGMELTRDDVARHEARGPSLFRLQDGTRGGTRVVARVAAGPPVAAEVEGRGDALWIEDRLEPHAGIIVTLGLRYDAIRLDARRIGPAAPAGESLRLRDSVLSPHVGVAWDPRGDGTTKIFVTARRYHDELHPTLPFLELRQTIVDVDLGDGTAPLPAVTAAGPPNVTRLDRDLRAPRLDEWTLGVEREIATETRLTVTAIGRRYVDQLGFADLNHAAPLSPGGWATFDPTLGEVLRIGNLRGARARSYVVELVRRLYRSWELRASYTWHEMRGDGERLDPRPGDEPSRWQQAPGADSFVARHVLAASGSCITPWGVRIAGTLRWESGLPYTAFESGLLVPLLADGSPAGVPLPRLFVADHERNTRRNGSTLTIDLRVTHERHLGRGVSLELFVDGIDLLDDRELLVRDTVAERGAVIDGTPHQIRRYGRRLAAGAIVRF